MKYIHYPTLLFHGVLLLLAQMTIHDAPGFFLLASVVLLIFHAAGAAESKRVMAVSHTIGCAVQAAVFYFGIIDVNSGAFGLGGGEFALFFYGIALAVSFVIEWIIGALKWKT